MGQSIVADHLGIGVRILLRGIAGWLVGGGLLADLRVLSDPQRVSPGQVVQSGEIGGKLNEFNCRRI